MVWRIASYIWYALPLCFLYKCILLIAIQLTPAQVQQQDVAPVELLCSIAGALHASAEQRCAT